MATLVRKFVDKDLKETIQTGYTTHDRSLGPNPFDRQSPNVPVSWWW